MKLQSHSRCNLLPGLRQLWLLRRSSKVMALPNLHSIYLTGNPLSDEAVALQIPALQARGVQVTYEPN